MFCTSSLDFNDPTIPKTKPLPSPPSNTNWGTPPHPLYHAPCTANVVAIDTPLTSNGVSADDGESNSSDRSGDICPSRDHSSCDAQTVVRCHNDHTEDKCQCSRHRTCFPHHQPRRRYLFYGAQSSSQDPPSNWFSFNHWRPQCTYWVTFSRNVSSPLEALKKEKWEKLR